MFDAVFNDSGHYDSGSIEAGAQTQTATPADCFGARAAEIYKVRRARERVFPRAIFGEPAWDMLLDLYVAHVAKKQISTTSIAIAACVPYTTAYRWIDILVDAGLVRKVPGRRDKRVVNVVLTGNGVDCMAEFFRRTNRQAK